MGAKSLLLMLLISCNPSFADDMTAHLPAPVADAQKTVLRVFFPAPPKGIASCSGVRLSEDFILTAAHCVIGEDGGEAPKALFLKIGSQQINVTPEEIGHYDLQKGRMEDWAVLRIPTESKSLFQDLSIAALLTKAEMRAVLSKIGDFANPKNKGTPLWALTFPRPSARQAPRPSIPPGNGLFASRGFTKSVSAFKKHLIYAQATGKIHDDEYDSPPQFAFNLTKQWPAILSSKEEKMNEVVDLYQRYQKDRAPLIYHTADYSYSSSGGGFFLEKSGHLIGLCVRGRNLVDTKEQYRGMGQLYRIDRVCAQSKALAKIKACRDLR